MTQKEIVDVMKQSGQKKMNITTKSPAETKHNVAIPRRKSLCSCISTLIFEIYVDQERNALQLTRNELEHCRMNSTKWYLLEANGD